MIEFTRKCPDCDVIIKYSNKYSCKNAKERGAKCSSCYRKGKGRGKKEKNYFRNCPKCKNKIGYTHEKSRDFAEENKIECRSCKAKIVQNRPEHKANLKEKLTGKSHVGIYESWLKKYDKKVADKMWEERCKKQSETMSGKNNPMYGKNIYDIWEEKYDETTIQDKINDMKKKLSIASSGENNPMYGKPAPRGSGNGWQGWYKGIYFASLREFFYLKYLIDNNIEFENGEKREYKIEYEFMGKKLNYFLDFYLPETDVYVEIKPKKLVNSPKNSAKFIAAREKLGEKFKVITEDDIESIDIKSMYQLYLNKDLIFNKKYEEKFIEYYNGKIERDE